MSVTYEHLGLALGGSIMKVMPLCHFWRWRYDALPCGVAVAWIISRGVALAGLTAGLSYEGS